MMNKKKSMAFLLCGAMLISTFISACGTEQGSKKDESTAQVQSTAKAEKDSILTEPGTFPIVKEGNDITLSVFTTQRPTTDSYNSDKNIFTKWFEQKTGIKFNFTVGSVAEAKQKLNLLMSSGEYTDIIMGSFFSKQEETLYSKQGILVPLNELVEKQAVNTRKYLAEYSDAEETISLLDGKFYGLPSFPGCVHADATRKLWINKEWLSNLNLKMPETTDEFYEVLKAFRDKDPNKNNKKDEIPMAGAVNGWDSNIDAFLMNAFIYNDNGRRMLVKDGKVDVSYNKPEWKEGLKYINKLYKEKLIAPESLTMDETQLKALGENADATVLGCAGGGFMGTFTQIEGESGRWLKYEAVPPLKGPQGVRLAGNGKSFISTRFYVTDKCKYPEAAVRVGDAFLDTETWLIASYGEKDKSWRYAKDNELGLDGKKGLFVALLPLQKRPANDSWRQVIGDLPNSHTPQVTESPLEHILYEETVNKYMPYYVSDDNIIPPLVFTEEDAPQLVELETAIQEYLKEAVARFISGDVDFEAGWDNYLKELENKGLSKYIELYQKAYDAKFKK